MIQEKEVWKDVPGYEGLYQVSNMGRVKSLERYKNNHSKKQLVPEIIKSINPDDGKYLCVALSKNSTAKTIRVYQLVAIVFLNHIPNKPSGLIVDHKDDNKSNNNLSNLQLITTAQNNRKEKSRLTNYLGTSNHGCGKYQSRIVIDGIRRHLGTFNNQKIAHSVYLHELEKHERTI